MVSFKIQLRKKKMPSKLRGPLAVMFRLLELIQLIFTGSHWKIGMWRGPWKRMWKSLSA